MNNKNLLFLVSILLLILGLFLYYKNYKNGTYEVNNPKNADYIIEGQKVTLKNGLSELKVEGSSTKIKTQYFGNEVNYDFDGDGRQDTAFLLTQNTGGSGTFYYLVVALNTTEGFIGSEAMFIGDRIAPQTTEVNNKGFIVVNYADRKPNESFATPPSLGKSLVAKFDKDNMTLGEVVQNFEGEADVNKMTLSMKKWVWLRTELNDERVITPKIKGKFTLEFDAKNQFVATTDCNGVGGRYSLGKDKAIKFGDMISTLMYCDGSQEADFRKFLEDTTSYHFTSKGELILDLKYDSGSVIFN